MRATEAFKRVWNLYLRIKYPVQKLHSVKQLEKFDDGLERVHNNLLLQLRCTQSYARIYPWNQMALPLRKPRQFLATYCQAR